MVHIFSFPFPVNTVVIRAYLPRVAQRKLVLLSYHNPVTVTAETIAGLARGCAIATNRAPCCQSHCVADGRQENPRKRPSRGFRIGIVTQQPPRYGKCDSGDG